MNILNILCVGNKSPMQRGFFNKKKKKKKIEKNSCLKVSRGLYVISVISSYIFFNIIIDEMICRRMTYFRDSEMIKYYQKRVTEIASL